ncbi:MAG TPA: hypothetical protein VGN98_08660 [Tianweitania sediminis]|jgi:hypothetical protein|nr:hypothetical protein [Tianweitania sediminis]
MDLIAGFRLPDGEFEYFATIQPRAVQSAMLAMRYFIESHGIIGWVPTVTYDFASMQLVDRICRPQKRLPPK